MTKTGDFQVKHEKIEVICQVCIYYRYTLHVRFRVQNLKDESTDLKVSKCNDMAAAYPDIKPTISKSMLRMLNYAINAFAHRDLLGADRLKEKVG